MEAASRESKLKALEKAFQCFICMEKLEDAHLCPHCSNLCCYKCISRWLSEQGSESCPNCRVSLVPQQLIKCCWVGDVIQNLDTLQTVGISNLRSENASEKRCTKHLEEFSVYCSTCRCCLCHECALGGAHSGHIFKPIAKACEENTKMIMVKVQQLKKRRMRVVSLVEEVERNKKSATATKDEKVRDVRNAAELQITCLDSELKAKLFTLTGQMNSLTQEKEMLDALLLEIEQQLHYCTGSELVTKIAKWSRKINAVNKYKHPIAA